MALILRSLFGLSCVGEAMPGASDPECAAAIVEAEPLRAALEKAPSLDLAHADAYEHRPRPEPAFQPAPAPAPGPRR